MLATFYTHALRFGNFQDVQIRKDEIVGGTGLGESNVWYRATITREAAAIRLTVNNARS